MDPEAYLVGDLWSLGLDGLRKKSKQKGKDEEQTDSELVSEVRHLED
jgi:hypothetical protein